jgi:hypothetical protein
LLSSGVGGPTRCHQSMLVGTHGCELSGSYLCRRVLVAFYFSQRIVSGIEDELRRVVAEEALAHVHNGLNRRSLRGFVDD